MGGCSSKSTLQPVPQSAQPMVLVQNQTTASKAQPTEDEDPWLSNMIKQSSTKDDKEKLEQLGNQQNKRESAKANDAAGAEDARLKKEAEETRLKKEEEETRLKKEAEETRLEKEAEDARLEKEAENARLKKEAEEALDKERLEAKRVAEEKARLAVEEENARKLAQEAEMMRKRVEEEKARLLAEEVEMQAKMENTARLQKEAEEESIRKEADRQEIETKNRNEAERSKKDKETKGAAAESLAMKADTDSTPSDSVLAEQVSPRPPKAPKMAVGYLMKEGGKKSTKVKYIFCYL